MRYARQRREVSVRQAAGRFASFLEIEIAIQIEIGFSASLLIKKHPLLSHAPSDQRPAVPTNIRRRFRRSLAAGFYFEVGFVSIAISIAMVIHVKPSSRI